MTHITRRAALKKAAATGSDGTDSEQDHDRERIAHLEEGQLDQQVKIDGNTERINAQYNGFDARLQKLEGRWTFLAWLIRWWSGRGK